MVLQNLRVLHSNATASTQPLPSHTVLYQKIFSHPSVPVAWQPANVGGMAVRLAGSSFTCPIFYYLLATTTIIIHRKLWVIAFYLLSISTSLPSTVCPANKWLWWGSLQMECIRTK